MSKFSLPSDPVLPLMFQIICAVCMVFGLVAAAEVGPLILIVSVFMLYLLLLRQGFQFDREKRVFRSFRSVLGAKWGAWEPIDTYSCIVCMHKRMSGARYALSNRSMSHSETISSINLMNDTHLVQKPIYLTTNRKRCVINAERLCEFIELPIRVYNPKKTNKKSSGRTRSSK